jgi:hypothetical protein
VIRKLSTWLVVALAGGVLVAGCGSGSNSTSSAQSTPTTQTTPTAAANDPAVQKAVVRCKQGIYALPAAVPAYAKTSLGTVCEKDARLGLAAVEKATRNLCIDGILNANPPFREAVRTRLMANCRQQAR